MSNTELTAWPNDSKEALEIRRRVFHAICDYCRKTKLGDRLESNTLTEAQKERQGMLFETRGNNELTNGSRHNHER